jgi:hypothetical protein
MSKFRRFFVSSKPVEQDVCGTSINFYPNRIISLGNVEALSGDVLKAVKVLFEKQDGRTSIVERHDDADGFSSEKIVSTSAEPAVIKARDERTNQALQTIVQAVCSRKSQVALGTLLMDSMRDEFPYKRQRSMAEIEEFLYGDEGGEYPGLEVPQIVDMLKGWLSANAQQFGDVGKRMAAEFLSLGKPESAPEAEPEAEAPTPSGEQSSEAS